MPRIITNCRRGATDRQTVDADLCALVSRMTCACAESSAHHDAPLARALFHRVEVRRQSPSRAARALGIGSGDAVYLLAGLREDVAKDLVLLLYADRPAGETRDEKEISDE